jgi:hypothetical protein
MREFDFLVPATAAWRENRPYLSEGRTKGARGAACGAAFFVA